MEFFKKFVRQIYPNSPNQTQIKYLPGCERFLELDHLDTKVRDGMVAAMEATVCNFMTAELGEWYERVKVSNDRRYRTLQFEMQLNNLPSDLGGGPLNEISKVKEWEKASGCSIKITKITNNGMLGQDCLVSVIGPKGSNCDDKAKGTKSLLALVEDAFRGQR